MKLFLIGFVVAVVVIIGVVVILLKPSVEVSTSATPKAPSGEQPTLQLQETPPSTQAPLVPVLGITITIRDCKADPYILEVKKGSKISLINADAQAHTLFLAKPTGGSELALLANGSFELEIDSSFITNFTYNYTCDDKSLPYGGAIYVK